MPDPTDDLGRRLTDYAARWRDELPTLAPLDPADLPLKPRTRIPAPWLAAAVAVAIAIAAPFTFLQLSSGPDAPSHDVRDPASSPGVAAPDCDSAGAVAVQGKPAVPEGAIGARLCGGREDNGGFNMQYRQDTLSAERTSVLVARLNDMEPYEQQQICRAIGGESYGLVLLYGDGTQVRLDGSTGGCPNLRVQGGTIWKNAAEILGVTQRLITEQRNAEPVPNGPIDPPACPQEWNDVYYTDRAQPLQSQEIAVTACRYLLDLSDRTIITQSAPGTLTESVLVANPKMLMGLIEAGDPKDPCPGEYDLDANQDVLLVRDRHGDTQVISTEPCVPTRVTDRRLYPSAALAAYVRTLFSN